MSLRRCADSLSRCSTAARAHSGLGGDGTALTSGCRAVYQDMFNIVLEVNQWREKKKAEDSRKNDLRSIRKLKASGKLRGVSGFGSAFSEKKPGSASPKAPEAPASLSMAASPRGSRVREVQVNRSRALWVKLRAWWKVQFLTRAIINMKNSAKILQEEVEREEAALAEESVDLIHHMAAAASALEMAKRLHSEANEKAKVAAVEAADLEMVLTKKSVVEAELERLRESVTTQERLVDFGGGTVILAGALGLQSADTTGSSDPYAKLFWNGTVSICTLTSPHTIRPLEQQLAPCVQIACNRTVPYQLDSALLRPNAEHREN